MNRLKDIDTWNSGVSQPTKSSRVLQNPNMETGPNTAVNSVYASVRNATAQTSAMPQMVADSPKVETNENFANPDLNTSSVLNNSHLHLTFVHL